LIKTLGEIERLEKEIRTKDEEIKMIKEEKEEEKAR
jgi:hypothetical protein